MQNIKIYIHSNTLLNASSKTNMFSTPFPNKPWLHVLICVCSKSLWKTLWVKEKLLIKSNFSFSHSVLHPFRELKVICTKLKIVVCKLFQFG